MFLDKISIFTSMLHYKQSDSLTNLSQSIWKGTGNNSWTALDGVIWPSWSSDLTFVVNVFMLNYKHTLSFFFLLNTMAADISLAGLHSSLVSGPNVFHKMDPKLSWMIDLFPFSFSGCIEDYRFLH